MAINYATKYAPLLDERFRIGSVTANAVNNSYDWTGVHTVRIYNVPTAKMGNYTANGDQRYGSPEELKNAVHECSVERDRSFTFTIDRGNYENTMMVNSAGEALRRQIDEVVIPEIDRYRIASMVCGAQTFVDDTITASNAYESLLDADIVLSNANVPPFGRIAFVSPQFHKYIKLDDSFIKQSDIGQNMAITGAIGMVDNISIIRVPHSYLPDGINFVLIHADAIVSPQKLAEYKIHDNPPGINGWLIEGRVCYDAFVLESKKESIYVHQDGIATIKVNSISAGTGKSKITMEGAKQQEVFYQLTNTMPAMGDSLLSWTKLPSDGIISATNGQDIVIAIGKDDKAVIAGTTVIIAD